MDVLMISNERDRPPRLTLYGSERHIFRVQVMDELWCGCRTWSSKVAAKVWRNFE